MYNICPELNRSVQFTRTQADVWKEKSLFIHPSFCVCLFIHLFPHTLNKYTSFIHINGPPIILLCSSRSGFLAPCVSTGGFQHWAVLADIKRTPPNHQTLRHWLELQCRQALCLSYTWLSNSVFLHNNNTFILDSFNSGPLQRTSKHIVGNRTQREEKWWRWNV